MKFPNYFEIYFVGFLKAIPLNIFNYFRNRTV
jgi:hypothetical protein